MRVANILTCLKWEKVGQQQHLGKRQVVWKVTTPPDGIAEVLQDETQSQQGISRPATPATPSSNNISDSVKTEKEEVSKKVGVKSDEGIVEAESQSGKDVQAARPSKSDSAIPVDWLSYPYNSSDRLTLENRANKVKERVLSCGTNNELIGLYSQGKVSEPEIKWLKANLLNESELAQLVTIEGTKQGNLFSKQPETNVIEWSQIKSEIDVLMQKLNWSAKRGKDYLIKRYGKSSRLHLSDDQLIEFRDYLKNKVDKLG